MGGSGELFVRSRHGYFAVYFPSCDMDTICYTPTEPVWSTIFLVASPECVVDFWHKTRPVTESYQKGYIKLFINQTFSKISQKVWNSAMKGHCGFLTAVLIRRSLGKDFNYPRYLDFKSRWKCKQVFMFLQMESACSGLRLAKINHK